MNIDFPTNFDNLPLVQYHNPVKQKRNFKNNKHKVINPIILPLITVALPTYKTQPTNPKD